MTKNTQPITTREQALDMLREALWDIGTPIGNECLIDVVGEMGYAVALTDKAVIRLAQRQLEKDKRLDADWLDFIMHARRTLNKS